MTTQQNPVSVFISYAREDESWLKKLLKHLKPLERRGLISTWHAQQIVPGTNWAEVIDRRLEQASIILLLVSADFLASDYCNEVEMKRALERHEMGEARVIPIVVRPVNWNDVPFAHLQPLPDKAKAIRARRDQDQAFVDVVAGIRRAIEDLPLLAASASRAALPKIWNIPYPHNTFFTGRDALLSQLHAQLQSGQATALSQSPQAISGLGGIGKTQLAVEYAYRYAQDYEVVLWARAESTDILTSSYNTIAGLLNLPEQHAEEQEITIRAVKAWLQTNSKWLLILDNADDLDLLPPFLPVVPRGHILLTTRAWDMQRLATRLEVKELSNEQGAVLLLRRAGLLAPDSDLAQADPNERQWAIQLTQELGGLPLALDQAGAYLEATGMRLDAYYQLYQTRRQALLKERRSRIPDHPDPVATTWSISFQRVEEKNPAAADLLRLCAYLSPDAIPEEIITKGAPHLGPQLSLVGSDPYVLNEAIEALRAYSLLSRDPRTQTLSVHRLVQVVLRESMEASVAKGWKERVVLAVNATFPNITSGQWEMYDRLLSHALICARWIEQEQMTTPEVTRLLTEIGFFLPLIGQHTEAESLLRRALVIREQQLGVTHPDTVQSINNLILFHYNGGDDWSAESLLEYALVVRCRPMEYEHPHMVSLLREIACYSHTDKNREQFDLLTMRTLAMWEQLGPLHPDIAFLLYSLADLYIMQGEYDQAMRLRKYSLVVYILPFRLRDANTAYELRSLAFYCHNQGKYKQAELLYKRALTIFEAYDEDWYGTGPKYGLTAMSLSDLAIFYTDQGKYEQAELLLERAIDLSKQQLGMEDPATVALCDNLAILLHAMKQEADVKRLEENL